MDPNNQHQNRMTPAGQPIIGNLNNTQQSVASSPNMPLAAGYQPTTSQAEVQPYTPVPINTNPNSTQNTLLIAEIRDGIVIMNDGSFRSVVMLNSINFELMSPQEREAVEYSYQGFLNSLYFPVQIFVRSQKIDITPYLEKLQKIRSEHDNMLLAMLMEDYIAYITQVAEQTNIMDKNFYLVIPFYPEISTQKAVQETKGLLNTIFGKKEQHVTVNQADLEAAKTELRNRVQAVLNGLSQCGVNGLPLDTEELIELYYDAYNPDTATRQQLRSFDDLTAPIVKKGQGEALNTKLDRSVL